jgi:3-hydroxyisobutyrate dehydrogenase
MTHPAIGVVGIGNMGGGMAGNLLERGWPVHVRDIDAHKERALQAQGAKVQASPAAVAAACGLVIVCVVDAAQTEDVLFGADGIASVQRGGLTVMLCPTISPEDAESFAARLAAMGIDCIDAPMSGGPARARDGTMSLMVACADAAWVQREALIHALSSRVFRISARPGDGARTKLVNNLLAGINLVGAAEVLAMAQAMGLDLQRTMDVIEQSSGQSWIGADRMRRAIVGDFAPRAHMTLLEKDTRLAVQAAQSAGFAGPLGAAARDVFAQASAGGLDGLDDAALFQWLGQPRSG